MSSSSSCSGVADPVDSSLDNQLGQCSIEIPWFRTRSKSFCPKKKNHCSAFKYNKIYCSIYCFWQCFNIRTFIHDQHSAVTKILVCLANKRSRYGIKHLLTSFGSLFPLFFYLKVAGDHVQGYCVKYPAFSDSPVSRTEIPGDQVKYCFFKKEEWKTEIISK